MINIDWQAAFRDGLAMARDCVDESITKWEWFSDIINIVTYDREMDEKIGRNAIRLIKAITDGLTRELLKELNQEYFYLINLPFFRNNINWGINIRMAFWDTKNRSLDVCYVKVNGNQITELTFTNQDDWLHFIGELVKFMEDESATKNPQPEDCGTDQL